MFSLFEAASSIFSEHQRMLIALRLIKGHSPGLFRKSEGKKNMNIQRKFSFSGFFFQSECMIISFNETCQAVAAASQNVAFLPTIILHVTLFSANSVLTHVVDGK